MISSTISRQPGISTSLSADPTVSSGLDTHPLLSARLEPAGTLEAETGADDPLSLGISPVPSLSALCYQTVSSVVLPMKPVHSDLNNGRVDASRGLWCHQEPTETYIDMYAVKEGHRYFVTLGGNVGSRFRAMHSTVDVSSAVEDVQGTALRNRNNPAQYESFSFIAQSDGYLLVSKDNVGASGIRTYVYDATLAWA